MPAPKEIVELVEQFERNRESYMDAKYNETQTRVQFLNPLFRALGWDVENTQGYAEAYKDVVHEDALKVGRATKAPDYCFRIGGSRKFFLEAKKPSINLKDAADPAFQLRRYAWSAKLPISVLSNFASLAVYDCRAKPSKDDKSSHGRIHLWTCDQFVTHWNEIENIFSKESILRGSFDRFAVGTKNKRGTAEFDSEFLLEIEEWRKLLATNIALRNRGLSAKDLNYAVQQTIDRIIFLRIGEDRGIEPYGRLQKLCDGDKTYDRLKKLFREADDRYNSGLFHFQHEKNRNQQPDEITLSLLIDDKPLKEIFKRLYYPDSPYEFSVLSADILGQVYEQFLGKVIRLTASGQARIEDKPEVKKAGGVYYTPTYVVNHIVRSTISALTPDQSPKSLKGISVVDPACGSGSFLIGVYQYFLDWYLKIYVETDPEIHAKGRRPAIFRDKNNEWKLTTNERKRILLEHIYGVDIDRQAVEVTKLSLLLKVLESESMETLGRNREMFQERALPDLDNNIKCGNSLIGPEFFADKLDLDDDSFEEINPFDWRDEFPAIFKKGGFDVIVGNPPYHSVKLMDETSKRHFEAEFRLGTQRFNLYGLFIERSHALLNGQGKLGFIVPSAFLANSQYKGLREFLLDNFKIQQIANLEGGVFKGATVETLIITLTREEKASARQSNTVTILDQVKDLAAAHYSRIGKKQSALAPTETRIFELGQHTASDEQKVPTTPLKEIAVIRNGINTGNIADQIVSKTRITSKYKKLIDGKDVQRYATPNWGGKYVAYDEDLVNELRLAHDKKGIPWTARIIKETNYFEFPKLLVQRIRNLTLRRRLVFTYDSEGYYTSINIGVVYVEPNSKYHLHYLLGILNSKYMNNYFAKHFHSIQIKNKFLDELPIRTINFESTVDRKLHDDLARSVAALLKVNRNLASSKTPGNSAILRRQQPALERQIDDLVNDLYGISEVEAEELNASLEKTE